MGRTRERLDEVAEEITSVGGSADVAVLDALDEQGTPLVDMTTEDLLRAVTTGLRSNFVTPGLRPGA
ncbi:MAG: hypothetical protein ACRD0A_17935 [Acidimicrobiales bacterium]